MTGTEIGILVPAVAGVLGALAAYLRARAAHGAARAAGGAAANAMAAAGEARNAARAAGANLASHLADHPDVSQVPAQPAPKLVPPKGKPGAV
jgi:hypothetical protein